MYRYLTIFCFAAIAPAKKKKNAMQKRSPEAGFDDKDALGTSLAFSRYCTAQVLSSRKSKGPPSSPEVLSSCAGWLGRRPIARAHR
jgi:hypothetical protein